MRLLMSSHSDRTLSRHVVGAMEDLGFGVNVTLFVSGSLLFPLLYHLLFSKLKTLVGAAKSDAVVAAITEECISSLHGIIGFTAGALAIANTTTDVVHARYWTINSYASFAAFYFYYDTWALYCTFWHEHEDVQKKPLRQSVMAFMRSKPLMMVHHLILPTGYIPIILYFRNNLCDFFVGCFLTFELAVPFIAARNVMVKLNMKETMLYVIVGLSMICVFFVCRILIFMFMFWQYAEYVRVPVQQVLWHLPGKCVIGSTILLSMNIYWLQVMVKVAVRTLTRRFRDRHDTAALKED